MDKLKSVQQDLADPAKLSALSDVSNESKNFNIHINTMDQTIKIEDQ